MALLRRLQLQAILSSMDGVKKAYFQAPSDDKMEYPCIVYQLDDVATSFADGVPYARTARYQVTVFDMDPDTKIPDMVGSLPKSSFERFFTADGLNHYVFNLYF